MPIPNLGVIFHPSLPITTLIDFARRAESAGFDELWLWDDSFLPGALTTAAVALAHTQHIRVGIGLMPATVYNPLFAAMEITTLAMLYPGRFIPAFGHGVEGWLKQIGAAPESSFKALEETVQVVRLLLLGEIVTFHGSYAHLEQVQMQVWPQVPPPIYLGAMREKTLQLAGRIGDGVILTELSSPAYVRWAKEHLAQPIETVVYVHSKIGANARADVRQTLVRSLGWAHPHLQALGIRAEAARLLTCFTNPADVAANIPEVWLDDLSASGTPEQAAATIHRLAEAGATSVVLQPLHGDPACLEGYIRELIPMLKGQ
jgi:alkanesulfonate monooxygenase SsuD/methylene tetrahydromethanopterin reductase-like flavin-dependent oxidoreductase (luciferase family)